MTVCFVSCSLVLFRFGSLHNVTRLNVLVDENFYLEQFMAQMPNLIELGLNILTSARVRYYGYLTNQ